MLRLTLLVCVSAVGLGRVTVHDTICELSDGKMEACPKLDCCYNAAERACRTNISSSSDTPTICPAKTYDDSCLGQTPCGKKSETNCTECEFCCWDGVQCWTWKDNTTTSTCNDNENTKYCGDIGPKIIGTALVRPKPNQQKRYPVNSQVTVDCLYPYYLDPQRSKSADCTHNPITGYEYSEVEITKNCKCPKWTSLPVCLKGCEAIKPLSNMLDVKYTADPITHGLYDQNTMAEFFCRDGFYLESSMSKCEQGSWTEIPQCIGGCTPISSLDNTEVQYSQDNVINGVFRNGAEATFTCAAGYYLDSFNTSTKTRCVGSNWWGRQPKCIRGCSLLLPTARLEYDLTPVNEVYPVGTVAFERCAVNYHPRNPRDMKQICEESGFWRGSRNICDVKNMCPSNDTFFKVCEPFGKGPCNTESEVFGRCKKCCQTMNKEYDALCVSYGCFCHLTDYQEWVKQNYKGEDRNHCDWPSHNGNKQKFSAGDQQSLNDALDIAIHRFYDPKPGMELKIAGDIRRAKISPLNGFFGVLTDEKTFSGIIDQSFLDRVGFYCNVLRHFKVGAIFTLAGKKIKKTQLPPPMKIDENEPAGDFPVTAIVESHRQIDLPFLQQTLQKVSEKLKVASQENSVSKFSTVIRDEMKRRLDPRVNFAVFVTPLKGAAIFFDDGFEEQFKANGFIYIFKVYGYQAIIVKLPD